MFWKIPYHLFARILLLQQITIYPPERKLLGDRGFPKVQFVSFLPRHLLIAASFWARRRHFLVAKVVAIRIRRKLREIRFLERTGPVDAASAREVGGAVEEIVVGRPRIYQGPVRQLLTSPSVLIEVSSWARRRCRLLKCKWALFNVKFVWVHHKVNGS